MWDGGHGIDGMFMQRSHFHDTLQRVDMDRGVSRRAWQVEAGEKGGGPASRESAGRALARDGNFMQNITRSRETCHLYIFMKQTLDFVQHTSRASYSLRRPPTLS